MKKAKDFFLRNLLPLMIALISLIKGDVWGTCNLRGHYISFILSMYDLQEVRRQKFPCHFFSLNKNVSYNISKFMDNGLRVTLLSVENVI